MNASIALRRSFLSLVLSIWPKLVVFAFGLGLILTTAVAFTQNILSWTDNVPPAFIASIDVWKMGMVVGTTGTATAVLIALLVAERKYRLSREHFPHLTMSLRIRRTPVSMSYDVVMAVLSAKNTGASVCIVNEIYWDIKVISPYDDKTIEELVEAHKNANTEDDFAVEFPWMDREDTKTKVGYQIEPGETEETTHDFIVPAEIETVVVSAWVVNAQAQEGAARGWHRRTMHVLEK